MLIIVTFCHDWLKRHFQEGEIRFLTGKHESYSLLHIIKDIVHFAFKRDIYMSTATVAE